MSSTAQSLPASKRITPLTADQITVQHARAIYSTMPEDAPEWAVFIRIGVLKEKIRETEREMECAESGSCDNPGWNREGLIDTKSDAESCLKFWQANAERRGFKF